MFDPFGDYETAGYLRNIEGIKDLDELKRQENTIRSLRALPTRNRVGPIHRQRSHHSSAAAGNRDGHFCLGPSFS